MNYMIEIFINTISTIVIVIITKIFNRFELLNNIKHNLHGEEFSTLLHTLDKPDIIFLSPPRKRFIIFLYAIKTWYK